MTFYPVLLPGQSSLSHTTVLSLQMMQPIVQLLKKDAGSYQKNLKACVSSEKPPSDEEGNGKIDQRLTKMVVDELT